MRFEYSLRCRKRDKPWTVSVDFIEKIQVWSAHADFHQFPHDDDHIEVCSLSLCTHKHPLWTFLRRIIIIITKPLINKLPRSWFNFRTPRIDRRIYSRSLLSLQCLAFRSNQKLLTYSSLMEDTYPSSWQSCWRRRQCLSRTDACAISWAPVVHGTRTLSLWYHFSSFSPSLTTCWRWVREGLSLARGLCNYWKGWAEFSGDFIADEGKYYDKILSKYELNFCSN